MDGCSNRRVSDRSRSAHCTWILKARGSTAQPGVPAKVTPQSTPKPTDARTYTGQVTDSATGKPIAGASVTVLRRVSGEMPFDKWRKLGETKHQTDAKGQYAFTLPPDQIAEQRLYIEITSTHPDYLRQYGGYSFDMIHDNEKQGDRPFFENIEMIPAEKISGEVVTPEGKPAAGVSVQTFSTPDKENFQHMSFDNVTTDKNGHFQFNACKGGEAVFWIVPDDYAPSTHLTHAKRGDFGRFVLERGLTLKGRVVDVDGKPLPNIRVNANDRGRPRQSAK